jgi:hypothetical protein
VCPRVESRRLSSNAREEGGREKTTVCKAQEAHDKGASLDLRTLVIDNIVHPPRQV